MRAEADLQKNSSVRCEEAQKEVESRFKASAADMSPVVKVSDSDAPECPRISFLEVSGAILWGALALALGIVCVWKLCLQKQR